MKRNYGNVVLAEYYANAKREYGYASKCRMAIPIDMQGLRVLDVECRRGKGVYKFSELMGPTGLAVGVDPSPNWIQEAQERSEHAWRKAGLPASNMEFRVGYPECTGMADASFDVVFANCSVNLAYDPEMALQECARVLRAGGMLVLDTVVADRSRDAHVVETARDLGNAIQAAPPRDWLEQALRIAGFETLQFEEEGPVNPAEGFQAEVYVPVADSDEAVVFQKVVVLAQFGGSNG